MLAKVTQIRKFLVPIAVILVIGLVFFLSNRTTTMPNGEAIIASQTDYNESLRQVIALTHDGVQNFNLGQELDLKQKDDIRKATKILDNMNLFKPDEAAGFFEVGLLYYIVGDSDTALNRIQQSLNNSRLIPKLKTNKAQADLEGVIGDSHHILSLISFNRHDYDTALSEANLALTHVKRATIYVARAQAEIQLKRLDSAREDVNSALDLEPNNPVALRLNDFLHH